LVSTGEGVRNNQERDDKHGVLSSQYTLWKYSVLHIGLNMAY
jgi:hypothetical protein